MKKKIAIAGGSGLVGSSLSRLLQAQGDEVIILTRGSSKEISPTEKFVHWNLDHDELPGELRDADVVINLAGQSLAKKRLNSKFKQDVYKSRIDSTQKLITYLNGSDCNCNLLINASAIGYYGYNRGDEELTEDADPGNGFMAELCVDWEKEAAKLKGVRTVILRIGVVLSSEAGAYKALKAPVLLGLGSALASGTQYVSWIHINDLIEIIRYVILNNQIEGVVNACAPNPVRNKRLIGEIADSLNKAILLPKVPAFALRLFVGELAEALIGSLNVKPKKITDNHFMFQHPDIQSAVRNLNWKK